MACRPKKDCEMLPDIDYHPETVMGVRPAGAAGECCQLCQSTAGCVVGVLDAGTCYLKAARDVAQGAYTRAGRVSCRPIIHNATASSAAMWRRSEKVRCMST